MLWRGSTLVGCGSGPGLCLRGNGKLKSCWSTVLALLQAFKLHELKPQRGTGSTNLITHTVGHKHHFHQCDGLFSIFLHGLDRYIRDRGRRAKEDIGVLV